MTKEQINDGGPAFPCEGGDMSGLHAHPGMSLRDWFAGKLAPSIYQAFQQDGTSSHYPNWIEGVALTAYRIADAIIADRDKP